MIVTANIVVVNMVNVLVQNVNAVNRMISGCKNCGHESHCDTKLYKDFGEDKQVLVCHHCRCDVCERDYKRWSEVNMDVWDENWTDESIVSPPLKQQWKTI